MSKTKMILLSFLFMVLFLTMAQIVMVTRQLEVGGGAGAGMAAGDYNNNKHNSMGMQLVRQRHLPHEAPSSMANNNLVLEKGGGVRASSSSTSPYSNEDEVIDVDFTVVGGDNDVIPTTHQSSYQDFLEQERTGVIAQPLELIPNNDDDDDDKGLYEQPVGEQNVENGQAITNVGSQDLTDDDDTTTPFENLNQEEEEVGTAAADSQEHKESVDDERWSAGDSPHQRTRKVFERCAINLFGLPRAFASLVLPSMITNVIQQNRAYHCDYFIHYYNVTNEAPGRSGAGGDLDPQEILLLHQAVMAAEINNTSMDNDSSDTDTSSSRVFFISDSDKDFESKYGAFLNKIHTTMDPQGRLLYFPWKSKSYTQTSVNNIVKMWHSIDSVWRLMQEYADLHDINYTRVAMLRSDVVYVTPVNIWVGRNQSLDDENRQVVIPGFGRHPVSDRIVYGPYHAVKEWAANRFSSLDDHVDMMLKQHTGQGMHSERYVKYNIIPRIQNLNSSGQGRGGGPFEVVESETICFFRARADESVWIEDCDGTETIALASITQPFNRTGSSLRDRRALVESTLGRVCGEIYNFTRTDSTVAYLDCSTKKASTSFSSSPRVDFDADADEELGETLTLAETEAAIEAGDTVLGLNTITNEAVGMPAQQTAIEQFQEKDMVTMEEGLMEIDRSHVNSSPEKSNKRGNHAEDSEDWGEPDEDEVILLATM